MTNGKTTRRLHERSKRIKGGKAGRREGGKAGSGYEMQLTARLQIVGTPAVKKVDGHIAVPDPSNLQNY